MILLNIYLAVGALVAVWVWRTIAGPRAERHIANRRDGWQMLILLTCDHPGLGIGICRLCGLVWPWTLVKTVRWTGDDDESTPDA